jgi:predicted GNAT family acetyltransferase
LIQLSPDQLAALRLKFLPERQHYISWHILNTGNGQCYVDRWPDPRVILSKIGILCSLNGDPSALALADLREHLTGSVHTTSDFLPAIQALYQEVRGAEGVMLELLESPTFRAPPAADLRRLTVGDCAALGALPPELAWIGNTWGVPTGLAASGFPWGAFVDGKLASLAATFLVGSALEDVGIVTLDAYRGRGLATACAGALCLHIQARGHWASWNTAADNRASLRVAEKLGFQIIGPDVLHFLGGASGLIHFSG